jgi:KUP system potassium uptake protein
VKGTAVFMSSNPDVTPPVLLHHVKHNQVLHKQVVLLSIQNERVPEVPAERRVEVIGQGTGRLPGDRALRLHADAATCRP